MRRLVARFNRTPVVWRLALTSAGLTFAILLSFALVVGYLAESRIKDDFDNDLRARAGDLQESVRVRQTSIGPKLVASENIVKLAGAGGASFRVVNPQGATLGPAGAPDLGPPSKGVQDVRGWRVVTRPLFSSLVREPVAYVQYAKPRKTLASTLARLHLFLAVGVMCGTALALLAGLAVARRAMRPVAELTATAKEIARTRDPDVTLPEPESDDEVSDLSRTFDEMLRALSGSRAETQAALSRQREFVADASHELRTPLTSVLANLEMLSEELEGEQREMASSALRSSRRMRRLVADLLLLARADAGRRGVRAPTDLADVLREAAGEAMPLAQGHPIELIANDSAVVDGSRDDLHRLALNLIENSLVHTPPGTPVTASVRNEGDEVVLEVADRGPGVPAEMRERAFDRFVRLDGGGGGGSGLGLAIVRAVAESHGGSVEIADGDQGARFVVRLPRPEAERGKAAREPADTPAQTEV